MLNFSASRTTNLDQPPIAPAVGGRVAAWRRGRSQFVAPWIGWIMLAVIGPVTGCATWHTDADLAKTTRGLPPPRRHPGDVVLEVSFIPIRPAKTAAPLAADQLVELATDDEGAVEPAADDTTDQRAVAADIWKTIDETIVQPEVRYALRRNGLRIGRARSSGEFSHQLQKIRVLPTESTEVLEIADLQSELSHSARRITFRVGKRYELPVRQVANDPQVILATLGDQTVGRTLPQTQPLFAVRVSAADARSARLTLGPEIQYGAVRQSWIGNDTALRIENRRDAWVLSELDADVTLERGDVLVVGCREPAFGLGKQFFTSTAAEGDSDEVLMTIRVAELPDTFHTAAR